MGMGVVKECYPRIYALPRSKIGAAIYFGNWEKGRWRWDVGIRRRAFDWDVDIWEGSMSTIEGIMPVEGIRDSVIWTPSSSGRFSCRSFRRPLMSTRPILDALGFFYSFKS